MSGAHSILPPSGAPAWAKCAMWVTMNSRYPQGDTPESQEGTAAHWVFAEMLHGRQVTAGASAPNGAIVTDEMIDGAELYVDTVRERMPPERFGPIFVEQPVGIPAVHPECWGTPDTWGVDRQALVLEIVDYKYGHRFVDEYENEQLIAYYAGIVDELARMIGNAPGALDQALTVNFTVVQPRCFYRGAPVRTWSVRASDLRGHINRLAQAAAAALGNDPRATTNSECGDCPGRHACAALQQSAYRDAEFAVTSAPVELSAAAASLELRMLERAAARLGARIDGLQEVVKAYLRSGERVPFHRAEQGFGRQQWTMPVDQVLAMGQLFGVDLAKPGVVTPKQAQKIGVDESVIKAYSITPAGSVKLVPDDSADTRRVFGKTF